MQSMAKAWTRIVFATFDMYSVGPALIPTREMEVTSHGLIICCHAVSWTNPRGPTEDHGRSLHAEPWASATANAKIAISTSAQKQGTVCAHFVFIRADLFARAWLLNNQTRRHVPRLFFLTCIIYERRRTIFFSDWVTLRLDFPTASHQRPLRREQFGNGIQVERSGWCAEKNGKEAYQKRYLSAKPI
jgi:hypothetical protein